MCDQGVSAGVWGVRGSKNVHWRSMQRGVYIQICGEIGCISATFWLANSTNKETITGWETTPGEQRAARN